MLEDIDSKFQPIVESFGFREYRVFTVPLKEATETIKSKIAFRMDSPAGKAYTVCLNSCYEADELTAEHMWDYAEEALVLWKDFKLSNLNFALS